MDLSALPIAQLRARCEAPQSAASLRLLVGALRRDSRRGAIALAERGERRLCARRAEARRLAGLFAHRRRLWRAGARWVAGVDEVGVGPLAGPVVAAAVVLPERVELDGLNDSKQLARAQRERLAALIREQAVAWALGEVAAGEVDRLNVYHAALEAMRRAVVGLEVTPDHVLVDARTIPGVCVAQTAVVHGDAVDGSIAAASILAKVYRDGLMRAIDGRYPGYGFAQHKGYATRRHLLALRSLGPSPVHRRSFAPVAQAPLF